MPGLLSWMDNPSASRGISFAEDDGGWVLNSFQDIAIRAEAAAAQLRDANVERQAVVCTMLPNGRSFVDAIFGVWLSGATICPVVPPSLFVDEGVYVRNVASILRKAQPALIISDESLMEIAGRAIQLSGTNARTLILSGDVRKVARRPMAEIALLQFTSGSTGEPTGVRVSASNLVANINTSIEWLDMRSSDEMATWLPMHHDMGLIGTLLMPTVNGSGIRIMRPDQFVRSPLRWVNCFGKGESVVSAGPTFCYGYVASKVERVSLEGSDFSRWKAAVVGAEVLDPIALRAFFELLEPFGFRASTIMPSYGLAEATLTVTGLRLDETVRAAKIDWSRLRFGEAVEILEFARIDEAKIQKSEGWLASSGRVHAGGMLVVCNRSGDKMPEGFLGEIVVSGPWVAKGYVRRDADRTTRFENQTLHTGDAGFLAGGELFVVGRIAESLKIRGRSVFVEDLEAKLAGSLEIKRGKFVVLSCPGTPPGISIVAETDATDWAERAATLLKREVDAEIFVRVYSSNPGTIQRTSSGKPRRKAMWIQLQSGTLAAKLVEEF